jgi:SH3-like domain-containing protein
MRAERRGSVPQADAVIGYRKSVIRGSETAKWQEVRAGEGRHGWLYRGQTSEVRRRIFSQKGNKGRNGKREAFRKGTEGKAEN